MSIDDLFNNLSDVVDDISDIGDMHGFIKLNKRFVKEAYKSHAERYDMLRYDYYNDEDDELIKLLNKLFNWTRVPHSKPKYTPDGLPYRTPTFDATHNFRESDWDVTLDFIDATVIWLTTFNGSRTGAVSEIYRRAIMNGRYQIHSVKDKRLLEKTKNDVLDLIYILGGDSAKLHLAKVDRVYGFLLNHEKVNVDPVGLAVLLPDKEVNRNVLPFARLVWVSETADYVHCLNVAYGGHDKKKAFDALNVSLNRAMNQQVQLKKGSASKRQVITSAIESHLSYFGVDYSEFGLFDLYAKDVIGRITKLNGQPFTVKLTNRTSIPKFLNLSEGQIMTIDYIVSEVLKKDYIPVSTRVDVLELLLQCQFVVSEDLSTISQAKFLFGEELSDSDLEVDINTDKSKPKLRDSVFVF